MCLEGPEPYLVGTKSANTLIRPLLIRPGALEENVVGKGKRAPGKRHSQLLGALIVKATQSERGYGV
jgi:hypothetical protein